MTGDLERPVCCARCGRNIYATPYETKFGGGWIHVATNREKCPPKGDRARSIAVPAQPKPA